VVRCAGHQIAQMIGDDESHLSVRQHGSLRAAGRARGEKEPAGIVVFDCGIRSNASLMFADYCLIIVAERRCADRDQRLIEGAEPVAPRACSGNSRPQIIAVAPLTRAR
jgi:hypothetical protein